MSKKSQIQNKSNKDKKTSNFKKPLPIKPKHKVASPANVKSAKKPIKQALKKLSPIKKGESPASARRIKAIPKNTKKGLPPMLSSTSKGKSPKKSVNNIDGKTAKKINTPTVKARLPRRGLNRKTVDVVMGSATNESVISKSSVKKQRLDSKSQATERMKSLTVTQEKEDNFIKKIKKQTPKKKIQIKQISQTKKKYSSDEKKLRSANKSAVRVKDIRSRSRMDSSSLKMAGSSSSNKSTPGDKSITEIANLRMIKLIASSSSEKSDELKLKHKKITSSEKKKSTSRTKLMSRIIKKEPETDKKKSSSDPDEASSKKSATPPSEEIIRESSRSKERKIFKKYPVKHDFPSQVDSRGISDEISRILKRIEEKSKDRDIRRETSKPKSDRSKKCSSLERRSALYKTDKRRAEYYNYNLQVDTNNRPINSFINIFEISKKDSNLITETDKLLTMFEISVNREYYKVYYSPASALFWADIVLYNEIKDILAEYKPETLRKYWIYINSIGIDLVLISDAIKRNRKLLDSLKCGILPAIKALKEHLNGNYPSLEDYFGKVQVICARKTEVVENIKVDYETGGLIREKQTIRTYRTKNRYPGFEIKREYTGTNKMNENENPLTADKVNASEFLESMASVSAESKNKYRYLAIHNKEEKNKVFSSNEEDKFLFKILDRVIEGVQKEHPEYTTGFISEALSLHNMNIERTYLFLKNPQKGYDLFTHEEDEILLKFKEGQYEYDCLKERKGEENMKVRKEYLCEKSEINI